jgi:hypothetical protein
VINIRHACQIFLIGCFFLFLLSCGSHKLASVSSDSTESSVSNSQTLITDQLFDCNLNELDRSSKVPLNPFAVLVNQKRLLRAIAKNKAKVSLWLDWIEAKNGDLILLVEGSSNEVNLEEARVDLIRALDRLKRGIRRPPLRVWFATTSDQEVQESSLTGWLKLQRKAVKLVGTLSEDDQVDQCPALFEAIQFSPSKGKQLQSLKRLYEQEHSLGLRLLRAPRDVTSKACLKLFELDHIHLDKDELDQNGVGWHLMLRELVGSNDTEEPRYLTLPLPITASQMPIWKSDPGVLDQMWRKRALWWGAQACWREVKVSEIASAIPPKAHRWLHQVEFDQQNGMSPKLFKSKNSVWAAPISSTIALTKDQALEREFLYKIDLDVRGVLHSILDPAKMVVQRFTSPRIIGLWMGELNADKQPIFSAYLKGILTPYIPYEALLQLRGGQRLFELAYERKSTSSLLLVLSPKKKLARTQQIHTQALSNALKVHRAKLKVGDLLSTEVTPINAWRMMNEPSRFESSRYGVLKERLTWYLRTLPAHLKPQLYHPGRALIYDHGVWFGRQSMRSLFSLDQLP